MAFASIAESQLDRDRPDATSTPSVRAKHRKRTWRADSKKGFASGAGRIQSTVLLGTSDTSEHCAKNAENLSEKQTEVALLPKPPMPFA